MHLITELSTGGAQFALVRLLSGLDRSKYSLSVVCLYHGDTHLAEDIRALDIEVVDLRMTAKWRLDAFVHMLRILRAQRPAILHCWMYHANIPGRVLGRMANVPIIISSERTMGQESRLRYRLNSLTSRLTDRIICVSTQVADFVARELTVPREKIVVIPNGIDPTAYIVDRRQSELRQDLGWPELGFIIAAIGRPRPVKGYGYLLQAFDLLAKPHDNVHLLFVGDGPDRLSLMQKSEELGIDTKVTFLHDRQDIPLVLNAVDLLVIPSLHEGMPNIALEAMAAGRPVVATAVGGTLDVVVDSETGYLVPPGDSVALTNAIEKILADRETAALMGEAGRKLVTEKFDISTTIHLTDELYDSLLSERGR